ncbi:MAG: acyl carrier protein [Spirochaetales bacterium]|nr:acyl carrier protein [Spirochaetales bacterium]
MAEKLSWELFQQTLIASLGLEQDELKEETHLYNEIGLDSLGLFSLGMKLIKIYDIKLPLSIVATIQTLGDLYQALKTHEANE